MPLPKTAFRSWSANSWNFGLFLRAPSAMGRLMSNESSAKQRALSRIHKKPMHQLQGEEPMDLRRVIVVAPQVPLHNSSHAFPVHVGARERTRIEQDLPDIIRQIIAVPDPEVKELVTTKQDALEVQLCKQVVHPGYPLAHAVVVCVFRLEGEVEQPPGKYAVESPEAAIGT